MVVRAVRPVIQLRGGLDAAQLLEEGKRGIFMTMMCGEQKTKRKPIKK